MKITLAGAAIIFATTPVNAAGPTTPKLSKILFQGNTSSVSTSLQCSEDGDNAETSQSAFGVGGTPELRWLPDALVYYAAFLAESAIKRREDPSGSVAVLSDFEYTCSLDVIL